MKFDDEMDPRINFTSKMNEIVKCLIDQYYATAPLPPVGAADVNNEDAVFRLSPNVFQMSSAPS